MAEVVSLSVVAPMFEAAVDVDSEAAVVDATVVSMLSVVPMVLSPVEVPSAVDVVEVVGCTMKDISTYMQVTIKK